MIPVRVPVDAPIHTVGGIRTLDPGHPLLFVSCPVCDQWLSNKPITLVLVGILPEEAQG